MNKDFKIYRSDRWITINVKPTYSDEDVNNLIIFEANPNLPLLVKKNKKKDNQFIDLLINFEEPSSRIINIQNKKLIIDENYFTYILDNFEVTKKELFDSIVLKILLCSNYLNNALNIKKKTNLKGFLEIQKDILDKSNLSSLKFIYEKPKTGDARRDTLLYNTKLETLRRSLNNTNFLEYLNNIWRIFEPDENFPNVSNLVDIAISLYIRNNVFKEKLENKITKAEQEYNEFLTLEPLKVEEFHTTGRLLQLEIETLHYTTGTLFDNLELNSELSFAKYKNFNKIYKNNKLEIKDYNIVNDLIIYRQEKKYIKKFTTDINENVQIHCKNISNGLEIQVLLVKNSIIHNLDSLFKFLKMESGNFKIKENKNVERGILGNVMIENPKPDNLPNNQNWSSFQTPILADMIMNEPLFKKFLMLNDSEKISRDTSSLYIYFNSPQEKKTELENIKVGGWNKLSSRFGDLTAVITPILLKEKFFINIKVLRSFNREILNDFLSIFSKLLTLYNKNLQDTIDYFKSLYPSYKPFEIQEEKVSSKENSLPYINPLIFTNNVYSRNACQKHPPVIVENENTLEKDRMILFPKQKIELKDDTIEPTTYYCPYDKYKYPGLFDMRNHVPEHPIGFAPCCYAESHEKKNKEAFDIIMKNEEPDKIINFPVVKKNFIKSDEKIIKFLGQQGKLPPNVENFLLSIDPKKTYYRIGLDSIWYRSSLLGCCEYIKEILEHKDDKKLPLQKDLREEISNYSMSIVKQENVDWDENKIREYFLNPKNWINFKQFFSLIKHHYRYNILVLTTDGDFVFPNTKFSFKMNYNSHNPLILLLEHPNGIYEIIAFQEENTESLLMTPNLNNDDHWNKQWQIIYEEVYSTREYNNVKSIISNQNTKQFMVRNDLVKHIDGQILSNNGQVRFFILKNTIPLFLFDTCAPCNLNTCNLTLSYNKTKITKLLSNLTNVNIFVKKFFDYSFFIIQDTHLNKWIGAIPVIDNIDESESWFEITDKKLPIDNQIDILLEYLNEHNKFNEIFKKKHYSLILMDYILLYFSNFLGSNKEQKTIEIHDIDVIIDQFYDVHILFVNETIDLNDQYSPLFNQNSSLHYKNQLKIPEILESKVRFMLKWNIINNSSYLKTIYNTNELFSYYQHCFQFKNFINNEIQTSNDLTLSDSFHSYYEYIPLEKLPNEKIFFLYQKNVITLYPFFYTTQTIDDIHSIMNTYYDDKILDFDSSFFDNTIPNYPFEIQDEDNIKFGNNKYIIIDKKKYYIVLFLM